MKPTVAVTSSSLCFDTDRQYQMEVAAAMRDLLAGSLSKENGRRSAHLDNAQTAALQQALSRAMGGGDRREATGGSPCPSRSLPQRQAQEPTHAGNVNSWAQGSNSLRGSSSHRSRLESHLQSGIETTAAPQHPLSRSTSHSVPGTASSPGGGVAGAGPRRPWGGPHERDGNSAGRRDFVSAAAALECSGGLTNGADSGLLRGPSSGNPPKNVPRLQAFGPPFRDADVDCIEMVTGKNSMASTAGGSLGSPSGRSGLQKEEEFAHLKGRKSSNSRSPEAISARSATPLPNEESQIEMPMLTGGGQALSSLPSQVPPFPFSSTIDVPCAHSPAPPTSSQKKSWQARSVAATTAPAAAAAGAAGDLWESSSGGRGTGRGTIGPYSGARISKRNGVLRTWGASAAHSSHSSSQLPPFPPFESILPLHPAKRSATMDCTASAHRRGSLAHSPPVAPSGAEANAFLSSLPLHALLDAQGRALSLPSHPTLASAAQEFEGDSHWLLNANAVGQRRRLSETRSLASPQFQQQQQHSSPSQRLLPESSWSKKLGPEQRWRIQSLLNVGGLSPCSDHSNSHNSAASAPAGESKLAGRKRVMTWQAGRTSFAEDCSSPAFSGEEGGQLLQNTRKANSMPMHRSSRTSSRGAASFSIEGSPAVGCHGATAASAAWGCDMNSPTSGQPQQQASYPLMKKPKWSTLPPLSPLTLSSTPSSASPMSTISSRGGAPTSVPAAAFLASPPSYTNGGWVSRRNPDSECVQDNSRRLPSATQCSAKKEQPWMGQASGAAAAGSGLQKSPTRVFALEAQLAEMSKSCGGGPSSAAGGVSTSSCVLDVSSFMLQAAIPSSRSRRQPALPKIECQYAGDAACTTQVGNSFPGGEGGEKTFRMEAEQQQQETPDTSRESASVLYPGEIPSDYCNETFGGVFGEEGDGLDNLMNLSDFLEADPLDSSQLWEL